MSLHLGGIAGSVTVFVLLFGPSLLVLTPLVALVTLVGCARWWVGAIRSPKRSWRPSWRGSSPSARSGSCACPSRYFVEKSDGCSRIVTGTSRDLPTSVDLTFAPGFHGCLNANYTGVSKGKDWFQ